MGSHSIPLAELCERYRRLYVPAIADVLDARGLWHQCMDSGIQPLQISMRIAGPAFTALGAPERNEDKSIRLGARMIDELSEHEIAIFDTADDQATGHWGELLTNGALARGATGAVIDGGIRDTNSMLDLDFGVFYRFRAPRDARGRWNVVDWQTRVVCGGVPVCPGDIVVGDADGVVVVPQGVATDVLLEAEELVRTESDIRERVRSGESVGSLYEEYERF